MIGCVSDGVVWGGVVRRCVTITMRGVSVIGCVVSDRWCVSERRCVSVSERWCVSVRERRCVSVSERRCVSVSERWCVSVRERRCVSVRERRCVSVRERMCVLPHGRTKERGKLHHISVELVGDLQDALVVALFAVVATPTCC